MSPDAFIQAALQVAHLRVSLKVLTLFKVSIIIINIQNTKLTFVIKDPCEASSLKYIIKTNFYSTCYLLN